MKAARQTQRRPAIIVFMSNAPELELKDASPQVYDRNMTVFMANAVMTTTPQKPEPSRGFPTRSL